MFDPYAIAFVIAGTLAASWLQCGWRDGRQTAIALFCLLGRGFNPARAKAELARQMQDIATDGLVRAQRHRTGDDEIDEATAALLASRSLRPLLERHEEYRQHRLARAARAQSTLQQAANLAPVMGLAGTLLALGQLAGPLAQGQTIAGAIGMAVTTTFYGLLLAHGLFMPLAGMIGRRAKAEDEAREAVIVWLEQEIRKAEPRAATAGQAGPEQPVRLGRVA